MFFDYDSMNFYIKPGNTDMRYGIDRLMVTVQKIMKMDPCMKDSMFMFCSKNRKNIKALVWDKNGFWLLNKKLVTGTFVWPDKSEDAMKLSRNDIERMLAGADIFRKLPDWGNDLVI